MATKKVFDIIPPKEHRETAFSAKPQKKPVFFAEPPPKIQFQINKKAIWWPTLVIFALVCIGGAGYFLIEPKAELVIWPAKSPFEAKTQIVVGKDIAGEIKTRDCSFSQEFSATGVKSLNTKASGTIRVYNAYSTASQTLIANTRFVSDNGKLFRTPQKIVIPGAHYEGSKLIPGELDTIVEAGEAGEEYNIGPSTFSLPALAGTSRYTAFYAKSSSSMTGGSKRQVAQITGEDLASAQESLTAIALPDCQKTLQGSLPPEDYVINEEAIKSEITEINPLAQAGQEADKFTLNMKAKASALVFQKIDLENFAKTYIAGKVPEGKQLAGDSLIINYLPQDIDLIKGRIVLSVDISAEIYSTIGENSIKEAIKSKRPDEAASFLGQFSEISNFQIRLWPFWADKIPLEAGNIAVKLRLAP